MKISIIVVSYNEKEYLVEAIESCLNQDLPYNYEIIIGDDGSNDGSINIIEMYTNKYPDKVRGFVMDRSDVNMEKLIPSIRVTNVLKRAFEIARGEYITIISGDDLMIGSDRLSKQIEFLENNPNYSSCYTDYQRFGDDYEKQDYIKKCSFSNSVLWAYEYIHIGCFVFKKEKTRRLLDRFIDDTGLAFVIFCQGKSKHIEYTGYGYRQRNGSIMHDADLLELNILELMLFQDVLNYGGYRCSSLARFSIPLKYVYKHRSEVNNYKYEKYIENCKEYNNNIVQMIVNSSSSKKISTFMLICAAQICRKIYKFLGILESVIFN